METTWRPPGDHLGSNDIWFREPNSWWKELKRTSRQKSTSGRTRYEIAAATTPVFKPEILFLSYLIA
jgi:hypothetical protein